MLFLRLLGGLTLCCDQSRLTGPATQRHRLALLALLASSRSRPQSRDKLVAWLWPERDVEHARNLLNQGVHALRRAIGEAAIVSTQDELQLAPAALAVDVVAFEKAIAAGELARATSLYTGPFLDGFHLPGASEFEHWADEERDRLRRSYARTLQSLAEAAEARQEWSSAIECWRSLATQEPYNARVTLQLMRALDAAGNRAGAMQQARVHTLLLEQEFEAGPDPEVIELAERLRKEPANGDNRKLAVPSPDTSEGRPPTAGTSAPARVTTDRFDSTVQRDELEPFVEARLSPTTSDITRPEGSEGVGNEMAEPPGLERRVGQRRSLQASLLALWIAVAIGALVWRYRSPAEAPPSSGAIAILPFAYQGNPGFSYLAEGMVDLLSTKLDNAPGLRTVDQHALLGFVSRERVGNDLASVGRTAQHFGADRFVLGNIVEVGGRLAVSATIYDVERGVQGSIDASAASPSEIFDVADRFARRILSEVQDNPLELARVADQATSSLPALKAYIEGERELRHDRAAQALDAFQRAIQLDSAFALAHYRLALLTPDLVLARKRLEQARRYSRRLGEHQRGLIEAAVAYFRGDYKDADSLYHQILAAHPDDIEAWSMQGFLIGDLGYLNGYAWVDAREAFEHVLKLDPRKSGALAMLAAYAARDRRLADLDSLTERFLEPSPEPMDSGNVEGQRAVARGDSVGLERFITGLRSRPDLPAQYGAGVVTWSTGDLVVGRRLWHLITEPNRSSSMRVLARATLAKLELTNGRWKAASAELDSAARLDPGTALEHRVYYALTYFLKLPRGKLVVLRDSLARWNPATASRARDGLAAMHRPVHPYLKLYLLGMLSARLGDDVAARRYASALERADSSTVAGAFATGQAKVVRAEIAWRAGRAEEALTSLDQAGFWTSHAGLDLSGDSPFYTHIHERFARAELLYELGRMDEALRWYHSFTYEFLYQAPSHYRLAQIYQARGDTRAAIQHYMQFLKTWRDSDPMLRPKLQSAELELARLR